ncbi:hypothetical protein IEQ34_002739 [Dendrobium chrysotoxum]|uniref:Uncharacterized protein n=1 Tax=Dendrobium chrysotoxum TaxID=161865 RepID=A0AAV7HGK7_DENCH|nr:hypothetical protein IEQ34_002739 [Dendrobium chrysotoxum]
MESKSHLRLLLKYSMAVILAAWAFVWILKPTQLWKRSWHAAEDWARPTFLGEIGLNVVVFCFPVLAAAALAYAYLSISSSEGRIREKRAHLMTNFFQPVITSSNFGILSLGELFAMVFFIVFLVWTYYSNVSSDYKKMTPSKILKLNRKQIKLLSFGVKFGSLSEACLAVLLLPILRRMALLKIMGIQFEASVRKFMCLTSRPSRLLAYLLAFDKIAAYIHKYIILPTKVSVSLLADVRIYWGLVVFAMYLL